MKIRIFILCIVLVGVGIPATVIAIGVSVSPATLSLKTSVDKEAIAQFTVSNPSREVGLFEAYPEEFEDSLTLVPSRFVLEAGEKREVTVRARLREVGAFRTVVAVEAQPLGAPAAGIGGGVRLPLTLEVGTGSRFLSAALVSDSGGMFAWVLVVALTALLLFRAVSLSTLKRLVRSSTLMK